MIRRILLGLGGSASARSEIQYAVELADRYGAEVTGVTVVAVDKIDWVGPVPLGAGESAKELRAARQSEAHEHLEKSVELFLEAARAASIRHTVKREERRDAFDLLISEGRYHDLTICGLRGIFESGYLGEALGEAGETLARLTASGVRPLLAVSPEYRPIRRVLVTYSGSMESAKTLRQFLQLHPFRDIKLQVAVFNHTEEKAARLLAGAEQYCRAHGFAPETIHIPGSPKDQILPYAADWNADLIVLGNSAKNFLLRRVLGETALHVMRHADRPLFLAQ
ncbi:MAG: universal stress protein [Pirellulales bacterium]